MSRLMPSTQAPALTIERIDERVYALHTRVKQWCQGDWVLDKQGHLTPSECKPLDYLELIDELLDLRAKLKALL